MSTITIRPDTDIVTDWDIPVAPDPHYVLIDDAITYPTTPTGDEDRIQAVGMFAIDDNEYDTFEFEPTPGDVDEVTEIKIYLHGQIDDDGTTNYPEASYSINGGGSWSSDYECSSFPKNNAFGTANGAWHTITVGSISWTKAQIDQIQVRIRADVPDGSKAIACWNTVYALQILVTYETAVVGYGHDFLGIPAANIDSIIGIPTANIDNIMGL